MLGECNQKDMSVKEIDRIEVMRFGNKSPLYTWSASSLHWGELPKWLLHDIELEYPHYKIEVTYK